MGIENRGGKKEKSLRVVQCLADTPTRAIRGNSATDIPRLLGFRHETRHLALYYNIVLDSNAKIRGNIPMRKNMVHQINSPRMHQEVSSNP